MAWAIGCVGRLADDIAIDLEGGVGGEDRAQEQLAPQHAAHPGLGLGQCEAFDVALDRLVGQGGLVDVGIFAALAGAEDEHVEIDPDLAQQVAAAGALGGEVDARRECHGRACGARRRRRSGSDGRDSNGFPRCLAACRDKSSAAACRSAGRRERGGGMGARADCRGVGSRLPPLLQETGRGAQSEGDCRGAIAWGVAVRRCRRSYKDRHRDHVRRLL